MSKIESVFKNLEPIDIGHGLTIIVDSVGHSIVETDELKQWIEEHGETTSDDADGYTAFCDAVDSIACTHNDSKVAVVEIVDKDHGRDAAEEVAYVLSVEFCPHRKRWVEEGDDYDPTPTQFAADYITDCDWIVEAAKMVEDGDASEELKDAFAEYQEHSIAHEHDQGPEAHRVLAELRKAAESAGIDASP